MPKDLHRQLLFSPKLQLMHTVREDHFVIFGLTGRILELRRLKISSIVPPLPNSDHGLLPSCRPPIELHPCYAKSTSLKQKLSKLSGPDHLGFKAVRDDRLCRVLPTSYGPAAKLRLYRGNQQRTNLAKLPYNVIMIQLCLVL